MQIVQKRGLGIYFKNVLILFYNVELDLSNLILVQ